MTLANDQVIIVLAWLVNRLLQDPEPERCNRCGHSTYFHRLDDVTDVSPIDPDAEFRCIWPQPDGPPVQLCDCPGFVGAM